MGSIGGPAATRDSPCAALYSRAMGSAVAIRGILFDKDGTLLDYEASWRPINLRAASIAASGDADLAARLLRIGGAAASGGDVAPDSLLAAGNAAEIAAAWVAGGAPWDGPALTVALDGLFQAAAATVVPVPGLATVVARLAARGLALGIASSDNAAAVWETARHLGIAAHLAFVAGYDSGHGTKPGPGMAEAFCRATGLAPAAVAVVGDNRHDMAMGRAAGLGRTVGVLTGTGTRTTLAGLADLVVDSIADLEAALFGDAVTG